VATTVGYEPSVIEGRNERCFFGSLQLPDIAEVFFAILEGNGNNTKGVLVKRTNPKEHLIASDHFPSTEEPSTPDSVPG
jgi:hypothetical protein